MALERFKELKCGISPKSILIKQTHETQLIFPLVNWPELYFMLKVQITKIKVTHHKVIGNGWFENKCHLWIPAE